MVWVPINNYPIKWPFLKVNHYRLKYGLRHEALVHTEQQSIKSPKRDYICIIWKSWKRIRLKWVKNPSNKKRKKKRNTGHWLLRQHLYLPKKLLFTSNSSLIILYIKVEIRITPLKPNIYVTCKYYYAKFILKKKVKRKLFDAVLECILKEVNAHVNFDIQFQYLSRFEPQ